MSFGGQELFIILLVILVLFGGKKIPELLGGLGKGVRNFKKSMNEPDEDEKQAQLEKQQKQLEQMQQQVDQMKQKEAGEKKA